MKTGYNLSYCANKDALKRFEQSYGLSLFDDDVRKFTRGMKEQPYVVKMLR
jgi:hypothetical protein